MQITDTFINSLFKIVVDIVFETAKEKGNEWIKHYTPYPGQLQLTIKRSNINNFTTILGIVGSRTFIHFSVYAAPDKEMLYIDESRWREIKDLQNIVFLPYSLEDLRLEDLRNALSPLPFMKTPNTTNSTGGLHLVVQKDLISIILKTPKLKTKLFGSVF